MKKKHKTITAWADIGSHGGIFMFEMGPVADRYPSLLHIFFRKVSPNLKKVKITYEV